MSVLAALTVPHAAAAGATRVPRLAALACLVLAVCCLPLVAAGAVTGSPATWAPGLVGVAFWGTGAALAWRAAARAARRPTAVAGGGVIAAVLPDAVGLGPQAVLPLAAIDAVALHWFSIPSRGAVQGVGGAVGAGLIEAAYAGAGGNLGLAVCLYPRDASWLGVVPQGSGLPLAVAHEPGGRPLAVVKAHRLLVDGDLGAFAGALAAAAGRHGVSVAGSAVPPAQAPLLPDWLR